MTQSICIIDGHPDPDPARLCRALADAYAEKVDESTIIESNSADVNYAFKLNVLHQLERFFDEIGAHLKANP